METAEGTELNNLLPTCIGCRLILLMVHPARHVQFQIMQCDGTVKCEAFYLGCG